MKQIKKLFFEGDSATLSQLLVLSNIKVLVMLAKLVIFKLGLGFLKKDNKSHNFKHLHSNATCFDSQNSFSFKTFDKANSKFDLKFKEA